MQVGIYIPNKYCTRTQKKQRSPLREEIGSSGANTNPRIPFRSFSPRKTPPARSSPNRHRLPHQLIVPISEQPRTPTPDINQCLIVSLSNGFLWFLSSYKYSRALGRRRRGDRHTALGGTQEQQPATCAEDS